jgi:hypothetical protein
MTMLDALFTPVVQALGSALVAAVLALIVQLVRRIGIDLTAQQQAKIEHYARLAIQAAEEWAGRQIKAHLTPPQSVDKLVYATKYLLTRVPGLTEAEAQDLIHAQLSAVGKGAAAYLTHRLPKPEPV